MSHGELNKSSISEQYAKDAMAYAFLNDIAGGSIQKLYRWADNELVQDQLVDDLIRAALRLDEPMSALIKGLALNDLSKAVHRVMEHRAGKFSEEEIRKIVDAGSIATGELTIDRTI